MRCGGDHGVTNVLVGLHRIGILNLPDALDLAQGSGLVEREEIVDLLLEKLSGENFVPESQLEEYRIALWREYLRHRGEDPSDFYSEVEVTVRCDPGVVLDRFVETLTSILGKFDLRPAITFTAPDPGAPPPQLLIAGETVLQGAPRNRWNFEAAIRKSLSGW